MLVNGQWIPQESRFVERLKIAGFVFSFICGGLITILIWVATPSM